MVISASHNTYADNGIKFFSASGDKLTEDFEHQIEKQIALPVGCVRPGALGRACRITDATGRYIEFCKRIFPLSRDLKGLRLVVDCANGAGYHTVPNVFHELGADVIPVNASPNGLNINENCGTTHPEMARQAVLAHQADFGVVVDGDADRLAIIDASGRIYGGDELLYAIVRDRLLDGPVLGAVGTQMSNLGLERALARLGVPFFRSCVGDRYVLEALRKRGWQYGGEASGHLLCLDNHTTGDATISALKIFSALCRRNCSLSDFCADLALFPQVIINVDMQDDCSRDWLAGPEMADATASVQTLLGDTGRVVVRASGTEPLVRVMVESSDLAVAQSKAIELARIVRDARVA